MDLGTEPEAVVTATPVRQPTDPSLLSVSSKSSSISSKGGSKRLSAKKKEQPRKKTQKQDVDDMVSMYLGAAPEQSNNEDYHSLRVREVEAREREASARELEARANSAKANKETAIPSIDEKVKTLTARKQLIDDGI